MIYGIAESMLPLKPLFSPLLGLSLTILIPVFALLKLWVPLKSMLLSMRVRVASIGRLVWSSLFNIFVSLSKALHDCWMFNSHIFFADEKSLYIGLMFLPFKSEERNKPACAFENSFCKLQGSLAANGCVNIFYSCQQYEYVGKCLPPAELC